MRVEFELDERQADILALFIKRLQYEDIKKRVEPEGTVLEMVKVLDIVREAISNE